MSLIKIVEVSFSTHVVLCNGRPCSIYMEIHIAMILVQPCLGLTSKANALMQTLGWKHTVWSIPDTIFSDCRV